MIIFFKKENIESASEELNSTERSVKTAATFEQQRCLK